jgi:hypothetical protein
MIGEIALALAVIAIVILLVIIIWYFGWQQPKNNDRDSRINNLQTTTNTLVADNAVNTPSIASLKQTVVALNNSDINLQQRVSALENTENAVIDLAPFETRFTTFNNRFVTLEGRHNQFREELNRHTQEIGELFVIDEEQNVRLNRLDAEVFGPNNGLVTRVTNIETRLTNAHIP